MNTFQNKILELRKHKNYTQEDLAKVLHVSRQAISKWENGVSYPSMDILYNIAQLFEITIDDLFDQNDVRVNTFKNNNKIRNIKRITIFISIIVFIVLSIAIISLLTANKAYNLNTNEEEVTLPKDYQVGFIVVTSDVMEVVDIDLSNIESLGYPYYLNFEIPYATYYERYGLFNVIFGNDLVKASVYLDVNKCNYYRISLIFKSIENDELYIKGSSSWYRCKEGNGASITTTEKNNSKKEINFSVNMDSINTLESVNLIEFDINNNIINTKVLTYTDVEYTLSSDCLYIVLENKFVNKNNEYYYTREILTSGEINTGYYYTVRYSNDKGAAFNSLHIIPKLHS
jgi:DNA-binding XRE family transcriptional regulator